MKALLAASVVVLTLVAGFTSTAEARNLEGYVVKTEVYGWSGTATNGRATGYGEVTLRRNGVDTLVTIIKRTNNPVNPHTATMMLDMLSEQGRYVQFLNVHPYPRVGRRNRYWDAFYVDASSVVDVTGLSTTTVQDTYKGFGTLRRIQLYSSSSSYGLIQITLPNHTIHTIYLLKVNWGTNRALPLDFAMRIISTLSRKWTRVEFSTSPAGNFTHLTQTSSMRTYR